MNILVLTTVFPRWDGDYFGNYIFHMAAAHAEAGAAVRVIAPHARSARARERIGDVEVRRFRYAVPAALETLAYGGGIFTKFKSSAFAWVLLPFFSASFLVHSLANVRRADVVHAHWTLAGVIGIGLARLFRKPSVLTVYGVEVFTGRARSITRLCARWADHVICISEPTRQGLGAIAGARLAAAASVVPYGVPDNFAGSTASFDVHGQHGIDAGTPIVLSVGRLIERKGIEYLLRAIPSVVDRTLAHFVIVGEGPERHALERLARELGITDAVTFAGAVSGDRLPGYYAACEMFVHPIITDREGDVEGLGIVLLEAMAHGKPVVASGIGGVLDIVTDACGCLVPEKDPQALGGRIVEVLSDRTRSAQMGQAGRSLVAEQFAVQPLAAKVMDIYHRLLKSRAG